MYALTVECSVNIGMGHIGLGVQSNLVKAMYLGWRHRGFSYKIEDCRSRRLFKRGVPFFRLWI
jgi:hypothetical protein